MPSLSLSLSLSPGRCRCLWPRHATRKKNRTNDAIYMLERCINLEPAYVPAYLELFKLYRNQGIKSGQILSKAIQANPDNLELRLKFGYWLIENRTYSIANTDSCTLRRYSLCVVDSVCVIDTYSVHGVRFVCLLFSAFLVSINEFD